MVISSQIMIFILCFWFHLSQFSYNYAASLANKMGTQEKNDEIDEVRVVFPGKCENWNDHDFLKHF